MAEVFGVVAGATGALDVGGRVLSKLNNLRRTWKNAPQAIITLQNQINDMNLVLCRTRDSCRAADGVDEHGDFSTTMTPLLRTVERILRDLEDVLSESNAPSSNAKRRYEWLRREKVVLARTVELSEARQRISELLQSHGLMIGAKIRVEMTGVQMATTKNLAVTQEGFRLVMQGLERGFGEMSIQNKAILDSLEIAMHQRLLEPGPSDSRPRLLEPRGSEGQQSPSLPPEETAESATPGMASSSHHGTGKADTFCMWAAYRDQSCSGPCDCSCHYTPSHRSSLKTPRFLQGLFGTLFASSSALPVTARPCDLASCQRRSSATYELRYEFPLWLLASGIRFMVQCKAEKSLQVNFLRFRPRIPLSQDDMYWYVSVARMGDVVHLLREDPSKIHCVDEDGHGMLHYAPVNRGTVDGVGSFEFLMRAGADPYLEDDSGIRPADRIALNVLLKRFGPGEVACVSAFLPLTKIIHDLELCPVTEIIVGLRVGDVGSTLASLGPFDLRIDQFDRFGWLPIHWAAAVGNIAALDQLVQLGVNIDARSADGLTPLMVVVPRVDCARWLLDHGADMHLPNRFGSCAFLIACMNGLVDIVRLMVEEYGFDPNWAREDGRTGLHRASGWGRTNVIAYLLSMGADVEAVDDQDWNALHYSLRESTSHCCELLLEFGADITRRANDGRSVLHVAAIWADEPTMRTLARYASSGVDIHAQDDWGDRAEDLFRREPKTKSLEVAFHDLLEAFERAHEASSASDRETIGSDSEREEEEQQEEAAEVSSPLSVGREVRAKHPPCEGHRQQTAIYEQCLVDETCTEKLM